MTPNAAPTRSPAATSRSNCSEQCSPNTAVASNTNRWDPTGQPAGPSSHGLLPRRPIAPDPLVTELVGKEGNKLEERMTGEVRDSADYRNNYGRRGQTWTLVLSVLDEIGVPEIVSLTGYSRSAVHAVIRGTTPRAQHARVYERVTREHVQRRLQDWQVRPPRRSPRVLLSTSPSVNYAERASDGAPGAMNHCHRTCEPTSATTTDAAAKQHAAHARDSVLPQG
jgi:hypothetical protein